MSDDRTAPDAQQLVGILVACKQ